MLRQLASRIGGEGWAVLQLGRAGLLRPMSPLQLPSLVRAVVSYGELGAAVTLAAVRYRDAVALIDERGPLTFGDLDVRSNALANEWRRAGLTPGDTIAILARNHRGLIDALFASTKTGARVVLLNTDFGSTQIHDVVAREDANCWCMTTSTPTRRPVWTCGSAGYAHGPNNPATTRSTR